MDSFHNTTHSPNLSDHSEELNPLRVKNIDAKLKPKRLQTESDCKSTSIRSYRIDEASGDWGDEDWKAIRVEWGKHYVWVKILRCDEKVATCGWLLSEVLRQLDTKADASDIVGLVTKEGNFILDLHLSALDRRLPVLEPGCTLVPLFKEHIKSKRVNEQHFNVLRKIGAGGFSTVYLVRKRDTGNLYAIKVIDKQLMIERDKEEIIFNERNILARVRHKRIIRLHYAFQNEQKLFFVLDFCPGGELYYHLRKRKRFTEQLAKCIAYQLVQALEYLHSNDIIYRDLKPENILIDQDGFVKLTDFGLSKIMRIRDQLNFTFCGSLEYMAPEMITQSGHDISLDYYTLGVLLYELVVGVPPFYAKTRQDLIQNILKRDISYPPYMSKELQDLIRQLTHKDRTKRLQQNVTKHPWFHSLKQLRGMPIIEELPFDKLFLNQKVYCLTEGARCLAEEMTASKQSDAPAQYHRFANFSYGRE